MAAPNDAVDLLRRATSPDFTADSAIARTGLSDRVLESEDACSQVVTSQGIPQLTKLVRGSNADARAEQD